MSTVASSYLLSGRIFFVRCTRVTEGDISEIRGAMLRARAIAGRPLVFFNVMADDAPPESATLRGALAEFAKGSLEICSHVVTVLEGTGFQLTLKRSFIAGIMLVSGKRGRVFVAASTKDAIHKVPVELRPELARAMFAAYVDHANASVSG